MYQPELPGLQGPAERGLRVPGPSARYARLLAEQQRLLQRVGTQRQRVRRLDEELRTRGNRMASVLEPLRDRMLALDREVHALFRELLAPRRLSRQAHAQVSALYRFLQDQEALSATPATPAPSPKSVEDDAVPWDDPPPASPPAPKRPPGGLRELFLGLAKSLHPDRAQGAADLAARTDAMKEVNQAYRDGDLGRLLELERTWAATQAAPASLDEVERRCQALERINSELRAQVKALAREEKELRCSDLGRLLQQGKRFPRGADPLAHLEAEGREHVERLTKLRDLVGRFRDGEISLDQLLAGPDADAAEEDLDLDVLAELARLAIQFEAGRGRRGKGRR